MKNALILRLTAKSGHFSWCCRSSTKVQLVLGPVGENARPGAVAGGGDDVFATDIAAAIAGGVGDAATPAAGDAAIAKDLAIHRAKAGMLVGDAAGFAGQHLAARIEREISPTIEAIADLRRERAELAGHVVERIEAGRVDRRQGRRYRQLAGRRWLLVRHAVVDGDDITSPEGQRKAGGGQCGELHVHLLENAVRLHYPAP